MKNVASNYYMMKKYIKNQVYTNCLRTKMRFGHVSRTLKSVVLGKNGLGQFDIPCPSSCQVPKWWDIRVLGLVRLILKLLKKEERKKKARSAFTFYKLHSIHLLCKIKLLDAKFAAKHLHLQ